MLRACSGKCHHGRNSSTCPASFNHGNPSIIHEHMISHYYRIYNVTPKVDNREPKSWTEYIDRKQRQKILQKHSMRATPRPLSQLRNTFPQRSKDLYYFPHNEKLYGSPSSETKQLSASYAGDLLLTARSWPVREAHRSYGSKESHRSCCSSKEGGKSIRRNLDIPKLGLYQERTLRDLGTQTDPVAPDVSFERSPGSVSRLSPVNTENYSMYPEFELTQKKREKLEEEEKYLDFLTNMTNEVIQRNIFSNRVLMHVCAGHVEKHKGILDETRMWEIVNKLKQDLNITDIEE